MLISILGGLVGVAAIAFLLFCHRGFRHTGNAIRSRKKSLNVFPLGHERERSQRSIVFLGLLLVPSAGMIAQNNSASLASQEIAPLTTPAIVGPLSMASPVVFDAGPLGKLDLSGVLSGFGIWQNNLLATDAGASADISNGQVLVQKTTDLVQFYLQAGAYNIPVLGSPFLSSGKTVSEFYGALPEAYLKIAPKGDFSFQIGQLPTLLGAEDTFTFQNMNIERGLLWNQENSINRGAQVNYSKGKLSSSLSWNDGFYSDRYNWLTGEVTYAFRFTDSLEFAAGGNLGGTAYSSTATPLYQNNSGIYVLTYTHTAKRWLIDPYIQYTYVPGNARIGVAHATSTWGGAFLGSFTFTPHISIAGRTEYLTSSGNSGDDVVNLLYGPGSAAWSVTVTPTYQRKAFFARAEISLTHANDLTSGDAFGAQGNNSSQVRGMVESGFIF